MVTSLFNKTKLFLSGKHVTFAIILLGIAARTIQLFFFYNIRVDGMYQVLAMQNFAEGHGISLSKVLSSDLSEVIYEPLINWPPGYSILLTPFYLLFNHNYILAGLTLDILSAISLILICRRILNLLETPLYLVNCYTLITGFFIYYFYFIASSDAVALTFFMAAIYFTLLGIKKGVFSVKTLVLLIITLFLSGFIKYQFIPIVFIIPIFLYLKGCGEKNPELRKTGIMSFLGLAFPFALLLVYQKFTSGSVAYISEPTRGWFPENILSAWPAFPASFIKPETAGMLLPGSEMAVYRIFQIIHLFFFGGAFIFLIRRISKSGFRRISASGDFFYLTFFLSAGITILLLILSLWVAKEENLPGHWWTYIEEPRYYGLVNIMIHLCVFILFRYRSLHKSKFWSYLMIGLVALMLPETFRGIAFTANRLRNLTREEYSWQNDQKIQQFANSIIVRAKEKQPVDRVVVTGTWYYVYYRVSIYSHVPVLKESEKINDPASLNSAKPTLLLVILREKDFSDYQSFLSSKETELAGQFRGLYFYTTHVNQH